MRHMYEAGCIEFDEGGTTIWVQGPDGQTMLRIKAKEIRVKAKCTNTCVHSDIVVDGNVEVCVPTHMKSAE